MTAEYQESIQAHDAGENDGALVEVLARPIVADAPEDYDEIMSTIPVAPAWITVLVIGIASLASWALVILATRLMVH